MAASVAMRQRRHPWSSLDLACTLVLAALSAHWISGAEEQQVAGNETNSTEPAPAAVVAWPNCKQNDTAILDFEEALFTDLQGFGAVTGCFQSDCVNTDKTEARKMESCSMLCLSMPECKFWVWGREDGKTKCWFRVSDNGRKAGQKGFVTGDRSCSPPEQKAIVRGDPSCWMQDFDYNVCCRLRWGAGGNPPCWTHGFHYDRCCLPETVL
eukprot:TRINITY_DN24083_c0_g2_i1.p1 TRINITY_DN24083_c0_g2~~TRINITY_DN24083_c0_g2_i1.p1  ORF type:complete len:211 (-),score=26.15 TRINITY_DN24083_c0_g2_i1:25-657(-)